MNPLTLFLYVWLMITSHQALSQVETILEVDTQETIDTQVLFTLQDQLQDRLDRSDFKPARVEMAEASGQLVVTATVDTENEKAMAAYRRLFASTSLGLWNTYRTSDPEIVQWKDGLGPMEGFEFNDYMGFAILGICTREEDKQRILDSLMLKAAGIPDLKLLWSPPFIDPYLEKTSYELVMIHTEGQEEAPLTEAHIAKIKAIQDRRTAQPSIDITLNRDGASIWADMTDAAARDDYRSVAIVINDEVYSAPRVNRKIANGKLIFANDFTLEEASLLVQQIRQGRLAVPLKVVRERILDNGE